jgi:hypothetical protein
MNVTCWPWQTGFAEGVILMLAGKSEEITMVTAFDKTGLFLIQVILEVSWHVITSPLAGAYEKSAELVPAFDPFTFQWKAGDEPPFVGTAVKFRMVPWHAGFNGVLMVNPAVWGTSTAMVIEFEVTGLFKAQGTLETSIQVTTSLLTGVYVKTGRLGPVLNPLTFHW